MGQTRVDLLHLLEDLRDAYPGDLEETILTEIVANSLDPGYVEAALRRHFEPLLDAAFDDMLAEHYPEGVAFVVNGRPVEKRGDVAGDRASVEVRLPRKRKAAALGYVERFPEPIQEDRQGIAISTLGKVIRRGWDWLGVTCTSPTLVAGLVEAPALAAVLTLNKGDFVRAGRRGVTYLAYRKAIQEAASRQLAEWGESRDPEDTARRRAARPLEKDLETVLVDLADDYPALTALVERRAGGQRRLPTGKCGPEDAVTAALGPGAGSPEHRADGDPGSEPPAPEDPSTLSPAPPGAPTEAEPTPEHPMPSTLEPPARGPKRPSRYGLAIDFADQPDRPELGRLVESTVWVNTAHPAYARAVASRAEGYHVALTVGLSLAPLAAEPGKSQEFLTEFLARWGESLGRDRRRRGRRPR
jgi:hypothetical protein